MKDQSWRDQLHKGLESAKIGSNWYGVRKGILMGAWIAVALILPVAWYWKIAIYVTGLFIVGLVVQAFAMARERRQ